MKSAYRDDEAPLRERIEQLAEEREALRLRMRELREVETREKDVAREILETQKRIDELRGPAMDLEQLRIASPCKASWDDMQGDERVRFCGQCQKNVYNLSGMRRDEATALVKERSGEICVRMYRRADGTVLTTDCPVGARKKNVRRLLVLAAGGGAMAMAGGGFAVQGAPDRAALGALEAVEPPPREEQGKPEEPAVMGGVSEPQVERAPHPLMGTPSFQVPPATKNEGRDGGATRPESVGPKGGRAR